MDKIRRLEEIFGKFPGIGPRQAKRFVYHILAKSPSATKEFIDLLNEVKSSTAECIRCHRFFAHSSGKKAGIDTSLCQICSDVSRDHSTLMIVARDSDFETVEKSDYFRGVYFILGGTVPVMDKEPERRIRLKLLLERISQDSATLKEIILSLNTTPDGEHTAEIVRDSILHILPKTPTSGMQNVKITVLGRGLSTGAELEYVDSETIKNALRNRG